MGDGKGEVTEKQITYRLSCHKKDTGYCSKWNVEVRKSFVQRNDFIWIMFERAALAAGYRKSEEEKALGDYATVQAMITVV